MYTISEIQNWVENTIRAATIPKEPQELYNPISYMMSIGGKRIRPVLCLLSYNLFSDHIDDNIVLPAVGLEVFHTFTLIHDDIMDKASTRRNQPTVHVKWNENIAILSGDVMCIGAYQYLCQAAPNYQRAILQLFNKTAAQVCEGQQYDMNYEKTVVVNDEEYLQMIELKTAVLIACAAKTGAIAGGASAADADKMYEFGRLLGLAFQIQDDLLDAYGDVAVFGKTTLNDIVCNKKTFLLLTAMRQASENDKQLLIHLLTDKTISVDEKTKQILAVYQRLGVRAETENEINNYFEKALALLNTINVAPERKEYLQEFAAMLIGREK